MNGSGTQSRNDNYSYVGEYVNNLRHGYGTETLRDGTKFTGTF